MIDHHALQAFHRLFPVALDVLVRGTDEPPIAVAADEPLVVELELAGVADHVGVRCEVIQRAGLHGDGPVRIEQQEVVGLAAGELHQLRAVVPEVDPFALV